MGITFPNTSGTNTLKFSSTAIWTYGSLPAAEQTSIETSFDGTTIPLFVGSGFGDLTGTVIPEPTTYVLGMSGMLGALCVYRRFRRKKQFAPYRP